MEKAKGGTTVYIIAIAAATLEIIRNGLERAGTLAGVSPLCERAISPKPVRLASYRVTNLVSYEPLVLQESQAVTTAVARPKPRMESKPTLESKPLESAPGDLWSQRR